jgi:iron complex transport system permease protein
MARSTCDGSAAPAAQADPSDTAMPSRSRSTSRLSPATPGTVLGGFDGTSWARLAVAAPLIIGGSLLILLRARSLNGFLLGEEAAAHLGVDVRRERAILLGLASLVTAAGVAVAGLIGFVGLVVPHFVRLLVGPNARLVIPISALFGASLLAAADLVARMLGGIPVGVITAVIGAPFFLVLLRRARTGYEL